MIRNLDHIGIAVRSIEEAMKFYVDGLGLTCTHVEEVAEQRVKTAFIPVGAINLELIQPTHPESAVARFIERRGEGIQHIALRVGDIGRALDDLKKKDVQLIDSEPRIGAHGARIAFIHPKGAHGVLIELCER